MTRSTPAILQEPEQETRERLLAAAGEVFSKQGFTRATVRDICAAAGANVAAVNYHFRDKQGLYEAVMEQWLRVAFEKYPPLGGVSPDAKPEEKLRAFIRSFLFRILDEGRPSWHGRLVAREMIDSTPLLDQKVNELIRPMISLLESIVREIIGARASAIQLRRCALSIVGQCLFYTHARPVVDRIFPEQNYTPAAIEELAHHVAQFSLAGLNAMRASTAEGAKEAP